MVTASFTEFPCDRSLAPIPEWDAVEPAATARLTRSRERAITQRKRTWSLRPLLNRPGGRRLSPAQDAGLGRGLELTCQIQIPPSESKPRQANPNKKAWICLVLFVRIGAFQWVTAIPNIDFLPYSVRRRKKSAHRSSPASPWIA